MGCLSTKQYRRNDVNELNNMTEVIVNRNDNGDGNEEKCVRFDPIVQTIGFVDSLID